MVSDLGKLLSLGTALQHLQRKIRMTSSMLYTCILDGIWSTMHYYKLALV